MARNARLFHQLVEIAKQKSGRLEVSDPDVLAVMGKTLYRLPTQIWAIRTKLSLAVTTERAGRKITAYVLPAFATPVVTDEVAEVADTENPPATHAGHQIV